jgi:glycosyltransferase involved in cell wall biosynthesis
MRRWALAAGDFVPFGGMDRANHALARYLARSGRDVHVVAHRVSPDLAALPNLTIHRALRPLGWHLLGGPLLRARASLAALHLGGAHLLDNGGNTRWRGPTWIHYLHAAYEPEAVDARARIGAMAGRRQFLSAEADAIRAAPAIICNSERTASDVRKYYGVPADRIRVVYYGTDADDFAAVTEHSRRAAREHIGIDHDRPLAIFIGALGDRRKGFDALFDAWTSLCADPTWDADLVVVGVGAELPAWRQRAVDLGLASRVTFLGFRADVPRMLAAADVMIHPARYEAYGLGVHDALCRGIPAIVSHDAGVAERLSADLRPLTLQTLTPAALIDRVRAWRDDAAGWSARARSFGAALRLRSWDDMAVEIAGIVEQVG